MQAKKKKKTKKVAPASASIEEMDPLSMLKRFQNDSTARNYKAKKGVSKVRADTDLIGPYVIMAVETSVRMQYDDAASYYDLGHLAGCRRPGDGDSPGG